MSASPPQAPLREPGLSSLPGLLHGFTLRVHGSAEVRGAPSHAGPDALERALGEELRGWTRRTARQVHGAVPAVITADRPASAPPPRADALVTAEPGELLVVRTADCLPVLLAGELFGEPVVVAAVHVGWRGLVAGVLDRSLEEVERIAPTARLHAAFGPAIGPCCFEVGPDVAGAVADAAGAAMVRPGRGDRSMADLPGAARRILEMREVEVHGDAAPPCTRCRPDLYHSHRADGEAAGRMAAFVGYRV